MGATPDGYPPCPDSDCRIRAARTSDVDIAYGFETDYIKEIEPESFDHWLSQAERIRQSFLENVKRARFVDCGDSAVAYYYWTLSDSETGNLASLCVDRPYRRRGLGRWLVRCFEMDLLRHGLSTATLQVRSHNPARFLYYDLGYSTTSGETGKQLEMQKSIQTNHVV